MQTLKIQPICIFYWYFILLYFLSFFIIMIFSIPPFRHFAWNLFKICLTYLSSLIQKILYLFSFINPFSVCNRKSYIFLLKFSLFFFILLYFFFDLFFFNYIQSVDFPVFFWQILKICLICMFFILDNLCGNV